MKFSSIIKGQVRTFESTDVSDCLYQKCLIRVLLTGMKDDL